MIQTTQSIFRICLLLVIVTLCVYSQDALRVDVNLVNVFATVQDQRGEFVTGLTAGDFRVYDDDIQQEISVFEKDDRVESAIAVLLDTSGSTVDVLPMMKKGTLEFTQGTKRLDDLCVLSFGTAVHLIHDFREPVRDLRIRLESLRPYGTTVLFDALMQGMGKVGGKAARTEGRPSSWYPMVTTTEAFQDSEPFQTPRSDPARLSISSRLDRECLLMNTRLNRWRLSVEVASFTWPRQTRFLLLWMPSARNSPSSTTSDTTLRGVQGLIEYAWKSPAERCEFARSRVMPVSSRPHCETTYSTALGEWKRLSVSPDRSLLG